MTNEDLARALWLEAETILEEARGLLRRGAWNPVVRRAQEAVELALKAVLRRVGVEVPRVHDVGPALRLHADRLPDSLRAQVEVFAGISQRLARERERSFYGDEEGGRGPQALYAREDAEQALSYPDSVLLPCRPPFGLSGRCRRVAQ